VLDSVPLDGRIVLLELDNADHRKVMSAAVIEKSTRRSAASEECKRSPKVK